MTGWLHEILRHDAIAAAIVAGIVSIVLALIAWISGAGKWIAGEVSKSLDERRKRRNNKQEPPKKTLLLVADYMGPFGPTWSHHDFGNGRTATDCRTFLLLTNLTTATPAMPRRAEVKLCGWSNRKREVFFVNLTGPDRGNGVVPRHATAHGWFISFYVFPEVVSDDLCADITIFDQFGNANVARKIRFTNSRPDEPRAWRQSDKPLT